MNATCGTCGRPEGSDVPYGGKGCEVCGATLPVFWQVKADGFLRFGRLGGSPTRLEGFCAEVTRHTGQVVWVVFIREFGRQILDESYDTKAEALEAIETLFGGKRGV